MYLSLGQAAKEAGVAKSTISKALSSGKLSYREKNPEGYKIDPAELFRVYPKTTKTSEEETASNDWQRGQAAAETIANAAFDKCIDLWREYRRLDSPEPREPDHDVLEVYCGRVRTGSRSCRHCNDSSLLGNSIYGWRGDSSNCGNSITDDYRRSNNHSTINNLLRVHIWN
jgi:hypothetical protein